MALSDMIELTNEMPNRIVQRVPENGEGRFKMGAQLIVHQGQAAVFYRDGKSLDVFGPGRHTLTTANVPLLTNLISGALFGGNVFSAVVYYVALREFPQEGWGTRQPIAMQTPGQGLGWLLLGAHGTFSLQVSDPKRMVDTFVGGGQPYLELRQVKERLVNAITQAGMDWFAEVNPGGLMKAQSMLDEMATAVKIKAQDQFEAMGMILKSITIAGLSPLETSADKLRTMGLLDAQMYMQLQALETIQKSSQGGGGAGMGVGLGAGMGAGAAMGQMMGGILGGVQQPQQQAAPPAAAPAAGAPAAPPSIMGVTEAAAYLGVSVEDVVELCNSGQLKAKKIGNQYRISKAAIDEFMSS